MSSARIKVSAHKEWSAKLFHVTSAFDDWVASLGGSVSADAWPLLHRIFDEYGPVSREEAVRIGREHQLGLAREAVARVAHDIAVTTAVEPPPFEYRDEDGSIRLAFWGRYATSPIYGLTQARVTVEVAGFMQDEVVEQLRGVWPECRDHRRGLHATLSSDRAEWTCRAGGHAVADIGHLRGQAG